MAARAHDVQGIETLHKELEMNDRSLATSPKPSLRDALKSAPVRMIDIGDASLSYRRIGSGPDLVFVHGWPLDSNTFRDIAPRLAHNFTCHLIDLPGAGASVTHNPRALRLEAHPKSLRAVVDALGLTRYALLAHDSGGYAARVLAAEDRRVSALVLGDTELPNEVATVVRVLTQTARLPGGRTLLRQSMRRRAVRRSALCFGGCFRDIRHIDGEFHDLFVAPMLNSDTHASEVFELIRTLDGRLFDELPAIHARITVPTLLIWGSDDPIFPLASAQAMLPQFAGGATLQVIPGGKTFGHEEEPEAFAGHALAFLRTQSASAAESVGSA